MTGDIVVAKDRYGNFHEVDMSELSEWRVSVYGIIVKDGQILLVSEQNAKGKKCYMLPGGGMEFGESFEHSVEREVKEETGLTVKARQHIATKTNLFIWEPDTPLAKKTMQTVLVYYGCEFVSGDISNAGYDEWEATHMEMAEWISLDKIPSLEVLGSVDFREVLKQSGLID